jgi:Flp pilus assembly CpaF family ATPase
MSGKIINIVGNESIVHTAGFGVSLSIALAQSFSEKSFALIDGYIDSGRIAPSVLNVSINKTIADVHAYIGKMNPDLLKGYFEKVLPNLEMIASVRDSDEKEKLTPGKYLLFLSKISEAFDYTVLLSENSSSIYSIESFDKSSLILYFMNNNVASANNFKYFLDKLRDNKIYIGKLFIVLRKSGNSGLSKEMVEEYTNMPVISEMDMDDETFISSINLGKSPLSQRGNKFSLAVFGFAKQLVQEGEKFDEEEESIFASVDDSIEDEERQEETKNAQEAKSDSDLLFEVKNRINERLFEELNVANIDFGEDSPEKKKELIKNTRRAIENLMVEENITFDKNVREQMVLEILDNVLGFGPLEKFLRDESVTEIMVNGPDNVYIEKGGKLTFSGERFASNQQLMTIIERIVMPLGRRIDESSPIVDARLPDGSRVNAIIKPLSLIGPVLTIRKFSTKKLEFDDLVKFGSATTEMGKFLDICVKLRKNVIVSGGTGSGKTTLLNIVSSFIYPDERVVTIEDSAELKLPQKHVVSLETRPPNIEGEGEISIRRLVINSLRMRPDRIVVGETRGAEALDMLQAMNTGHDGSATTIHSNSPTDCIGRMVTLVMYAGMDLPEKAIIEQIASAVDIIVQTSRLSDGSRKITHISEVIGIKDGKIVINDIFKFEQTGIDSSTGKIKGKFACKEFPTFWDQVAKHGLDDDKSIFKNK